MTESRQPIKTGQTSTGAAKVADSTEKSLSPNMNKGSSTPIEIPQKNVPSAIKPGGDRVIISDDTLKNHVFALHASNNPSKSLFLISKKRITQLLKSDEVATAPATKLKSGNYLREVEYNTTIGYDRAKNLTPTKILSVITDEKGNLVSAFPGQLKRR